MNHDFNVRYDMKLSTVKKVKMHEIVTESKEKKTRLTMTYAIDIKSTTT